MDKEMVSKSYVVIPTIGLDGHVLPLEQVVEIALRAGLFHCRGNQTMTARRMKIGRSTLARFLVRERAGSADSDLSGADGLRSRLMRSAD